MKLEDIQDDVTRLEDMGIRVPMYVQLHSNSDIQDINKRELEQLRQYISAPKQMLVLEEYHAIQLN